VCCKLCVAHRDTILIDNKHTPILGLFNQHDFNLLLYVCRHVHTHCYPVPHLLPRVLLRSWTFDWMTEDIVFSRVDVPVEVCMMPHRLPACL